MSQAAQRGREGLGDLDRYRIMRDTDPVAWDPKLEAWNVYRYSDVAAVLSDHTTFSSDFSEVFPSRSEFTEGNILGMDPPRHHQLRSLVSQVFTPRAIGRLEGRIAGLTEELLDGTGGRSHIELVADLAYPLPVIVIAELLGVPAADRPQFKEWADALLSRDNVDPRDEAAIEAARVQIRKFHEYLRVHVRDRRARPREDLLSELVGAEIDGRRLNDKEIVGFATILLLAGHVTTTVLLGNAIRCLDEHPKAAEALRRSPESTPAAIEEVLRYRSPVVRTARVTSEAVALGGRALPARALVYLWLLSANHDDRQFERPDDFVIDRQPNPHVGFGKGIHFCLGAPLARLESKVALGMLLRRFASLRVDPEQPFEPYPNPGFNGSRSLHLVVEPA